MSNQAMDTHEKTSPKVDQEEDPFGPTMEQHAENIKKLKMEFINAHANGASDEELLGLIEKMRVIHGCAIYDDQKLKEYVSSQDPKKLKDTELSDMSCNVSLLYCMHECIRYCEKILFPSRSAAKTTAISAATVPVVAATVAATAAATKARSNTVSVIPAATRSNTSVAVVPSTSEMKVKVSRDGEIVGTNLTTEQPHVVVSRKRTKPQHLDDFYEETMERKKKNAINVNELQQKETDLELRKKASDRDLVEELSETIRTGFNRLTGQEGGHATVVVTNYWADWCKYSRDFLPVWKEFVKQNPSIETRDLNVQRDEARQRTASNLGVTAYPTVVISVNGTNYLSPGGSTSASELLKTVNDAKANQFH